MTYLTQPLNQSLLRLFLVERSHARLAATGYVREEGKKRKTTRPVIAVGKGVKDTCMDRSDHESFLPWSIGGQRVRQMATLQAWRRKGCLSTGPFFHGTGQLQLTKDSAHETGFFQG